MEDALLSPDPLGNQQLSGVTPGETEEGASLTENNNVNHSPGRMMTPRVLESSSELTEFSSSYIDRYQDPISEDGRSIMDQIVSGSRNNRQTKETETDGSTVGNDGSDYLQQPSEDAVTTETFPMILYRMLEDVTSSTDRTMSRIVRWKIHGRAFCIEDRAGFVQHIMPR